MRNKRIYLLNILKEYIHTLMKYLPHCNACLYVQKLKYL